MPAKRGRPPASRLRARPSAEHHPHPGPRLRRAPGSSTTPARPARETKPRVEALRLWLPPGLWLPELMGKVWEVAGGLEVRAGDKGQPADTAPCLSVLNSCSLINGHLYNAQCRRSSAPKGHPPSSSAPLTGRFFQRLACGEDREMAAGPRQAAFPELSRSKAL